MARPRIYRIGEGFCSGPCRLTRRFGCVRGPFGSDAPTPANRWRLPTTPILDRGARRLVARIVNRPGGREPSSLSGQPMELLPFAVDWLRSSWGAHDIRVVDRSEKDAKSA